MKKQLWLRSVACMLCIALLLPGSRTLAAGEDAASSGPPALTLICPADSGSAASAGQKLIWRSSAPVTIGQDAVITIRETGNAEAAVYTISAGSDDVALSGGEGGPWLISLDMAKLVDESQAAFVATAGASYTVTVAAGAFCNAADGAACAEMSAAFTLADDAGSGWLVTYALPDNTWSVKTVVSEGEPVAVPNGATVPADTRLAVTGDIAPGYEAVNSVTVGGNPIANPTMDNLTVTADTHIVVTLRQLALTGTATIAQTPQQGAFDALVCEYSGGADAHLLYTFYRDGAPVEGTGTGTNSYTPPSDAIGDDFYAVVTSTTHSGSVTSNTITLAKPANPNRPNAPVIAGQTASSVTLTAVSDCEYSKDGVSFQSDPTFGNLSPGAQYTFYQRYAETATMRASENSEGVTVNIAAELTGTLRIDGTQRAGQTLTASLSPEPSNPGALTYTWYSNGAYVYTGASYPVPTSDIGKTLTVEVVSSAQTGKRTAATGIIGKTLVGAPPAPVLASATTTSVTLVAVSGCEYSMDNVNWQDSPTFSNLASGQAYSFYQRYKATDMLETSDMSQASLATAVVSGLTGTINVNGDARYGKTLIATLSGGNNTGAVTFTWFRGATAVGTGASYDVGVGDIGYPLYVQAVSAGMSGGVTKLVGTVQKAEFVGLSPAAPTRESRSTTRVTLTPHTGYEYSRDGKTWQSSNVFSGLSAGKTYKFYQRIAATAHMDASPASDALTSATSTSSSSSSGTSSGTSSTGGDSGGTASDNDNMPSGTGALYSYTASGDNTRILFSTMERLVNGNKTQDVTITSGDVQFRFFKGTMQLTDGALWYDFGAEINDPELRAVAERIAGDSVVATIRFNHSGALPAKANIRIALGAAQAGKALYYYRLENDTLTYVQTAVADISGAVTVVQSSCSDYVLLDRDFYAPDATPEPTPAPSASPTPLMTEGTGSKPSGGGWFIVLVIIAALLLIVVGILFYLKSRQASAFDDGFGDFDDDPDDDPRGGHYLGDDYGDGYDDYGDDPLGGTFYSGQTGGAAEPYADPFDSPTQAYAPPQASAAFAPAPQAEPAPAPEQPWEPAPATDETAAPNGAPETQGKYPRVRYRP